MFKCPFKDLLGAHTGCADFVIERAGSHMDDIAGVNARNGRNIGCGCQTRIDSLSEPSKDRPCMRTLVETREGW